MTPTLELERELSLALAGKQDRLRFWSGTLKAIDSADSAAVAGRANYVYVAQPDGAVIQVYNGAVPPTPERVVIIGYDALNPRFLQVLGFRRAYAGGTEGASNLPLPLHAALHEYLGSDQVDVHARQFLPLRVTLAGGFTVSINGVVQTSSGWEAISVPLDLTSLVPGSDALWVLIYLNADGQVATRAGIAVALLNLTVADIPASAPGERALAAVRLYDGQTALREDSASNDFVDLRFAPPPTPDVTPTVTARFYVDGRLAALAGVAGAYIAPADAIIETVYIRVSSPGTEGSTVVDLNRNGSTVFTTQANRPTFSYSEGAAAVKSPQPDSPTLAEGDVLTVDIDQTAAGAAGLTILIALLLAGTVIALLAPPSTELNAYKLGSGSDNIVLPLGSTGQWDDEKIAMPCAVEHEGTVYLFFSARHDDVWQIGVATAPVNGFTGVNFTKYASNPILTVGTLGAWDAESIGDPWVIYDAEAGIWKMWYAGVNAAGDRQLGYATADSPFGPWSKHVSNPILSPAETWEGDFVWLFSVLRESAASYKMLYTGHNVNTDGQIGLATSADGIAWTKYAGNPVLGPSGSDFMSISVFSPRTLLKINGLYHIYFSGKYKPADMVDYSHIGYASSPDLINWTVDDDAPVLSATRTWEGVSSPPGEVENANLIQVGDSQYLFYSLWWGSPSTIGVAVIP